MSPADAIVAGTRTAAELLGPGNVVAVVQAGVVRKNTMQARGWHNAMSARQAGASAASHTNSTRTRQ